MKTTLFAAAAAAFLAWAPAAQAALKTKAVEYKQGDTTLQGFIAYDDAVKEKRPGVLVVHEWWGHNQHARNQAIRLAKAGYVAFALDMYGKGKVAKHPDDAKKFMAEATSNLATMDARFDAAKELLKKDPRVDPAKIAAIGYCFGGAVVLGQARAGEDLQVVGTFHGALGTSNPAQPGKVKARILVQNGAADPMIPQDQVDAFKKEMDAAGARYEVINYPGALHSFTNPDASKAKVEGLGYDAEVDKKSFAKLLETFKEVFGS
jgi:dienelactone hydrolase